MLYQILKIKNGDVQERYYIYKCDKCAVLIEQAWPLYREDDTNEHFCIDCAFVLGKITENEFLRCSGLFLEDAHAAINDAGEIETWWGTNNTPPSKRTEDELRKSVEYAKWRTSVYERDSYTCQKCNKSGIKLNAHHIKPFKQYPDLRLEQSNGITLCEECHKKVHQSIGE
jgi:hypothetical protein